MIIRNGIDVTDEIYAVANIKARQERERAPWKGALAYLIKARAELNGCPTPWCNDCIYDGIVKIDEVIALLSQAK
jgi:hypothetical protein